MGNQKEAKLDAPDPLSGVKLVLAYTVAAVWAIVFLSSTFGSVKDSLVVMGVQTAMMVILGALFVNRWINRNGRNGKNGDG